MVATTKKENEPLELFMRYEELVSFGLCFVWNLITRAGILNRVSILNLKQERRNGDPSHKR